MHNQSKDIVLSLTINVTISNIGATPFTLDLCYFCYWKVSRLFNCPITLWHYWVLSAPQLLWPLRV